MKIGIIGAGDIGQAYAGHFLKVGYQVILSNSRGPESLSGPVRELGAGALAGTVKEATAAEVVMLAVTWQHLPSALAGLPSFEGRIVIDATNPIIPPGFTIADLGGRTSSEVVAGLVPGAQRVKAGNTLFAVVAALDPQAGGGRRVLFVSGDDAGAKANVSVIFEKSGFAPIDLGGLVEGGRMQQVPSGPLAAQNLVKLP
jgi:8-hydroxy-5-deazaflavin:NADPH oxidoreductase